MKVGDKVRLIEDTYMGIAKFSKGDIGRIVGEACDCSYFVVEMPYGLLSITKDAIKLVEEKKLVKPKSKVVKYNQEDLAVGDEVYDCTVRKWRPVTNIFFRSDIDKGYFIAGDNKYLKNGQHEMGKFPSVVAIRKKKLTPKDIPTKEFVYGQTNNYILVDQFGVYKSNYTVNFKINGIKYYNNIEIKRLLAILNNKDRTFGMEG